MANTIKIDYKIQAEYLQMIAEDFGLVSKKPINCKEDEFEKQAWRNGVEIHKKASKSFKKK